MSAPIRTSDWPAVRLRFVAEVNPPPPARDILDDELEVSFLPMEAIGENGSLRLDAHRPVAELRGGYSYFADGDVAFAKVTPCFENGKGAVMRGLSGGVGFGSTELTVLRPGPRLDAQFLHFFLCSPLFRGPGAGAMMGAGGLKRVPDEFTRNTLLPHPPRHVQAAVTRLLDRETTRIDALIEKKTRFIELLREKRQAAAAAGTTGATFTDVQRVPSGLEWAPFVPEHWAVCKLSIRYSVELGKMLDEKKISGDCLMPYLRNQDVQWTGIKAVDLPEMDIGADEVQRYTVRFGDLLVCEGGDVGRAAIWRGDSGVCGYQKALHRLRPRYPQRDLPEFMCLALAVAKAKGVFDESDSKATISHLPAERFRQFRFPFPPLGEQQKILEDVEKIHSRIDATAAAVTRSIDLLRERRAALITAAVTGQIDVCAEQPDSTLEPT